MSNISSKDSFFQKLSHYYLNSLPFIALILRRQWSNEMQWAKVAK